MSQQERRDYIAFEGERRIASGAPVNVALAVKEVVDSRNPGRVLVFDARTSRPVELDLRGAPEDVRRRMEDEERATSGPPAPDPPAEDGPKRRGRPKLGVVGREVTLLPRHWEWLSSQPGGASVTLRKLVEKARRANAAKDRRRNAQGAAYAFMSAIAGNQPDFEEATRSLFGADAEGFERHTERWSADLRDHARRLAGAFFEAEGGTDA